MVPFMSARVAIGLPTYNRPTLLKAALDSLTSQTHENVEIVVSDNASPDPRVAAILESTAAADPRVRYIRQPANQGAAANFRCVLDASDAPFFMWASDDDIWAPEFVARCLAMLQATPNARMAFASIDNINLDGVRVRSYSGFSRFTSTGNRAVDLVRFLDEPEMSGKANLIYGLFETNALKSLVAECWDAAGWQQWGGDVVMVAAFLARYSIVASDEVLLHKRLPTHDGAQLVLRNTATYLPPPSHVVSFVRRHGAVAPDAAARRLMLQRHQRRLRRSTMHSANAHSIVRSARPT